MPIRSRFLRVKQQPQLNVGPIVYAADRRSWTRTSTAQIRLNQHLTAVGHPVGAPPPPQSNLNAYNGLYGYDGGSYGSEQLKTKLK